MASRYYYSHLRGMIELKSVVILSKRQQKKCTHVFKNRRWRDIISNWASVCCKCGITCRGSRQI